MKKVLILFISLLIVYPQIIHANNLLLESVPRNGEVVSTPPQVIMLIFQEEIETIEYMNIYDYSDYKVDIKDISIMDNEITAKMNSPLENGPYLITWKVVGENDQTTVGSMTFEIFNYQENKQITTKISPEKELMTSSHRENKILAFILPIIIVILITFAIRQSMKQNKN